MPRKRKLLLLPKLRIRSAGPHELIATEIPSSMPRRGIVLGEQRVFRDRKCRPIKRT